MDFTEGTILDGKVKTITKFGAFVSLPGSRTGMVHISEIAHAYVSDIREHLTEDQEVKVMVISVDPAGKVNLSIKRTQEPPKPQFDRPKPQFDRPKPQFDRPKPQYDKDGGQGSYAGRSGSRDGNRDGGRDGNRNGNRDGNRDGERSSYGSRPQYDRSKSQDNRRNAAPAQPATFDDMVKQFINDSDTKISSIKQYSDHKSKTRRR